MNSNNEIKQMNDETNEGDTPIEQLAGQPSLQQNDHQLGNKQTPSVRYAGFWMRLWAYLVDLIIIGSLGRMVVKPIFRLFDISLSTSIYQIEIFAPISIISAIIFYGYFVLMTKYLGQTVGKMIFGLKVIPLKGEKLSWGTILFREWIGRFISATTWIGYLIVAFLPQKQGIHDLFSDTTVIHER